MQEEKKALSEESIRVFPNVFALDHSSSEIAISLLETSKVICVPGTAFGLRGEGYLRISYASSPEDLEEGVRRIKEGVINSRDRSLPDLFKSRRTGWMSD